MYERAQDLHWGLMTLHQGVWAGRVRTAEVVGV